MDQEGLIEPLQVDVTVLLHTKRRAYGVPNSEFLKYAEYCTRRISRLRHFMRKSPGCVGMKGPKFDLSPELNQNVEHMHIVLFTADGTWARYRHLSYEHSKDASDKPARRAHALSRLRKCQKWWQLAHDCATTFCSAATQLEVQAHQLFARGYLQLELAEWQNALATFSDVSATFAAMSDVSHDATFAGFVTEIQSDIAPLLEFCRFNLNDGDAEHINIGLGNPSASSSPHRLAQAESTSSPSSRGAAA
jgi:signal recognition particle subunit SRP68